MVACFLYRSIPSQPVRRGESLNRVAIALVMFESGGLAKLCLPLMQIQQEQ